MYTQQILDWSGSGEFWHGCQKNYYILEHFNGTLWRILVVILLMQFSCYSFTAASQKGSHEPLAKVPSLNTPSTCFTATYKSKTTGYCRWRVAIGDSCHYYCLTSTCTIRGIGVDTYVVYIAKYWVLWQQLLPWTAKPMSQWGGNLLIIWVNNTILFHLIQLAVGLSM